MVATGMLEEERKYDVPALFVLPGLRACVPKGGRVIQKPAVTLRATYFDTADLRLARAGVSLRYRSGDADLPWTVKLPTGVSGIRHEISRPVTDVRGRRSSAAAIPADLVALVSVYTRLAPLAPVVTVRTTRTRWDLCDSDGVVLAEVADDLVAVLDDRRVVRRFREIEVERKAGSRKVLRRVEAVLTDAGAVGGSFVPKHVRALDRDLAAPDLPAPAQALPRRASAAEAITEALRTDIAQILHHDPLVRLRATVGRQDTAVHQMRVGVRRLRSTLRQFRPLLRDDGSLLDELGWLGSALGGARDAEVQRARLRSTAALDPVYPLDGAAVERIDAELAARGEEAREALDEVLGSTRYAALVDRLVALATDPDFTPVAQHRAAKLLPRFVRRAWHRLADGRHGIDGANGLDSEAPDEQWHAVRLRAKRARYATDATVIALGAPAGALAAALATVTDLLGAHHDATAAADTWLGIAAVDPDDHALAITAGRLAERERMAARAARDSYPEVWRAATKARLTAWLP